MKRFQLTPSRLSAHSRQGVFMVVAMICLLLTGVLLATLLRLSTAERHQTAMESAARQTKWLAESALDRAAAKLTEDPGYSGETWNVLKNDLGGLYTGRVEIQVLPGETDSQRLVKVIALFPVEGAHPVKRTKLATVAVRSARSGKKQPAKELPAKAEKPPR